MREFRPVLLSRLKRINCKFGGIRIGSFFIGSRRRLLIFFIT
jgi:hypothetical protein